MPPSTGRQASGAAGADRLLADGERVTIVEFESEAAQRAWSRHPDHVGAQKKGRKDFYSEYRLLVCRVERESVFPSN